jgi:hypothetical protein
MYYFPPPTFCPFGNKLGIFHFVMSRLTAIITSIFPISSVFMYRKRKVLNDERRHSVGSTWLRERHGRIWSCVADCTQGISVSACTRPAYFRQTKLKITPVAVVVVVILQPCHTSLLRSPKVGAMTSRRAETHQWRQSRHGTCILRVALASGVRHRSASQLYGTFGLVRIFLPPCLEK